MILSLTAEKNCIMSKISLGKNMSSRAIWNILARVNFSDNKIARACRASAICSLCKIYQCLLHRIVICSRVTTLHSCCIRMHSFFSQSKVRDFFLYNIILKILSIIIISRLRKVHFQSNFQLIVESNPKLQWFFLTSLFDWSRKLVHLS